MNHDSDDDIEYISKSQQKREALALQSLGERLTQLTLDQIQQLELPDALRTAIIEAKSIVKPGARQRHIKYVGKLMRNIETEHIKAQYEQLSQNSAHAVSQLHKIEKWRERLLLEGDQALAEFLNAFPDTDRQQLRLLIRTAKSEAADNKPPRAYRKLFQLIKAEISE